jgi:hypothetical protein
MKSTVSQITLHASTDRTARHPQRGRSRYCPTRGHLIDGLAANAAKNQLQHLNQLHPQ